MPGHRLSQEELSGHFTNLTLVLEAGGGARVGCAEDVCSQAPVNLTMAALLDDVEAQSA